LAEAKASKARIASPAADKPRRTRRKRLLTYGVDAAIALVVIGVVLLFSSVRDTIGDWFGGSSKPPTIALPVVKEAGPLDLGRRMSLAAARDTAAFPLLAPTRRGYDRPNAVYFSSKPAGGTVSLLYGSVTAPRLLVTELAGSKAFEGTERVAPDTAIFHYFELDNGGLGAWLGGGRGRFAYRDTNGTWQVDRFRLAANVLIWERPPIVVKIEGKLSRSEAAAIASSMQPVS
jgi:hypothetical protein